MKKQLILLFTLAIAFSARIHAQNAAQPAQKAAQATTVFFDDIGKFLTEEDADTIKRSAVELKRERAILFHFITGYRKSIEIDEFIEKIKGFCKMGTTPEDNTALLCILNNKIVPDKKPVVCLVPGKGFANRLDNDECAEILKPLLKALDATPDDKDAVSSLICTTYLKCRDLLVDATQKQTNQTRRDSFIMPTIEPAPKPQASGTSEGEEEFDKAEELENLLPDPGAPEPFIGQYPPKPSSIHYVLDYADMLLPSDRAYIETLGSRLDGACGAEIVLVTVQSRSGIPIDDYALEIANGWGIGKKGKDNGCLLLAVRENLLAHTSGRVTIKTGYGLEGCLPDAKCGRILDNVTLPPFSGQYDKAACSKALRDSFAAIATTAAREFNVDIGCEEEFDIEEESSFIEVAAGAVVFYFIMSLVLYGMSSPIGAFFLYLPIAVVTLPVPSWRKAGWKLFIDMCHSNGSRSSGSFSSGSSGWHGGGGGGGGGRSFGGGSFGGGGASR